MSGIPMTFQFTCPSRSTTTVTTSRVMRVSVSIHVPLAEHDVCGRSVHQPDGVSIHVPLAEHDISPSMSFWYTYGFNSRAPRGARPTLTGGDTRENPFQFTCPSRSTTKGNINSSKGPWVSIHVPLAEHDFRGKKLSEMKSVSIHVPLAEHDDNAHTVALYKTVSIHVPLAEHDPGGGACLLLIAGFNSRAPRGARRQ